MLIFSVPMPLEFDNPKRVYSVTTVVLKDERTFSHHAYLAHIGESLATAFRSSGINKTHWIILKDHRGGIVMSTPGMMPLSH